MKALPGMARLALSPETYQLIVRHVPARMDLCALARVSRDFQRAAERALYNTLHMRDASRTISLCTQLANTPRLAQCVEALTFFVCDDEDDDDDDMCSQYSGESSSAASSSSDASMNGYSSRPPEPLPPGFWDAIAGALRAVNRLHFLNIYLGNVPSAAQAWILRGTRFQLHTLHCDLSWDADLAACLATQNTLRDLCIADFKKCDKSDAASAGAMMKLTVLECAHTDAACVLVPSRPVARLKTCLSAPAEPGARETELAALLDAVSKSTEPLRAFDLGDAAYDARFSLHLLNTIALYPQAFGVLQHLGTLSLPVAGPPRLQIYGALRRLPTLRALELELGEWPSHMQDRALVALAREAALYCPWLETFVFVAGYDRSVVRRCRSKCWVDEEASSDGVWRET